MQLFAKNFYHHHSIGRHFQAVLPLCINETNRDKKNLLTEMHWKFYLALVDNKYENVKFSAEFDIFF